MSSQNMNGRSGRPVVIGGAVVDIQVGWLQINLLLVMHCVMEQTTVGLILLC